ncbi:MAG TPA: dTDP-4-dehydrorhamnose 3,5-epimerase [Candidatus Acidoferrum sp.]|nr:dTDP-4-dehydrorhamnose 3,5-epimerase [Candidatus Acidoferrum sp.]
MDIEVHTTKLEGVLLIDTKFFRDERGFFIENYHKQRFAEHGIRAEFVQDNHSGPRQGVLRGLHYQDMTAPMGKLVRCTAGTIQDVAVDLRVGSPTCGQWVDVELSAENMRQIWIPPGFGHGFVTLSEYAEVQYKCSGLYTPPSEGTVAWNDPDLAIDWRVRSPQVSARDGNGMSLKAYLERPAFRYTGALGR